MKPTNQTPGIKIRTTKDKVVRLVDRQTGKWLANVRWRPCGEIYLEMGNNIDKEVKTEGRNSPGIETS